MLDEAVSLIADSVINQVRQNSAAPVFLGISGIDCSGKTTLAKALLERVVAEGVTGKLVMADNFFIPVADRQSDSEPCVEWFEHTFDYPGFTEQIRSYGRETGLQLVIGEGVFLFRQERVGLWDQTVWMEMSTERSLACGMERDAEFFGSAQKAETEYLRRFIPAHEHHMKRDKPSEQADFVFRVE